MLFLLNFGCIINIFVDCEIYLHLIAKFQVFFMYFPLIKCYYLSIKFKIYYIKLKVSKFKLIIILIELNI